MSDMLLSQAELLQKLAQLPGSGGQTLDPVRLRYLQALAQRMQAAPAAVQRVLQAKLQRALADAGAAPGRVEAGAPRQGISAALGAPGKQAQQPASPLAKLNQDMAAAMASPQASAPQVSRPELRSATRFRETWSRISAEHQVDQAVHRGPENAGPLNSHMLVLRTLGLMRELSPDYLRRFLLHTEALLWLDQAAVALKQPADKGKRSRAGAGRR